MKNIKKHKTPRTVREVIEADIQLKAYLEKDENGDSFVTLRVPVANARKPIKNFDDAAISNSLIPREKVLKELGIADSTLWRWEKEGKIKVQRIGKKVFIERSSLPGNV